MNRIALRAVNGVLAAVLLLAVSLSLPVASAAAIDVTVRKPPPESCFQGGVEAVVELVDGTELSLELFFVELTASQAAGDATGLNGFIDLDIVDPDDDGMILFSEFGDLSFDDRFDLEMGVNATVNLDLEAGLAVEGLPKLEI